MIKSWLERSHEAKHILSVDKFLVDSPDLKVGPNLVLILSKIPFLGSALTMLLFSFLILDYELALEF